MKNETNSSGERIWEDGFAGHSDAQLLRLSKLTFEEKLKWLDNMNRFILRLQSSESDS